MSGQLVLVTGGSGFIGAHCIVQLLAAGYRVRTTVRSLAREPEVRAMLATGGATSTEALSFVAADLMADAGWPAAVAGCDYVLHVASPFPAKLPKHEDELVIPAREGTLRVLRAARDAGVKRLVLTSSFAAIGYGVPSVQLPYTEENWTNPDGRDVRPYVKSKALAERAAWDFIAREGGSLELSVVNPVAVFGPVLGADYSSSIMFVQRLLDGTVPGAPQLAIGIVDVRDVADLHLRAMTSPAAKGERFIAVAGDFITLPEMASLLRTRIRSAAGRVPTRILPNWLVRLVAVFDKSVAQIVPELGQPRNATNAKAKRVLGWQPRSREDALIATAESLVKLGLLQKPVKAL